MVMSAYADSSLNKPIDTHRNDLDLEITRLWVEYGELADIDSVRFRLGLRWRYVMGCVPSALNYLCQQDLVPFDLNDILLSSLIESPLATVLPDGQLSSFLKLVREYGENTLTNFTEHGEALILGILPIHVYETFESPRLQKEVLNEAVISICMLLSHGFGSPPKPLTEDFLRRASDIVNKDPDFMKVVWELALELTGRMPSDCGNDSEGTNGDDDGCCSECGKSTIRSEYEPSTSEDDLADQRVPGAWVDEGWQPDAPKIRKIRKYRSVPGDFDGTIWGHKWDPKTYLV